MAGFFLQLKALIQRNLLLKKRKWMSLAMEILGPLIMLIFFVIIKVTIPVKTYDGVPKFNSYPMMNFSYPHTTKTIMVTPNTSQVHDVMDKVTTLLSITATPKYKIFATEEDLKTEYKANSGLYWAAIVFADDDLLYNATYKLRSAYTDTPDVTSKISDQSNCRASTTGLDKYNCLVNSYLYSGFTSLQLVIDNVLIQLKTGNANIKVPDVDVQMMPQLEYTPSALWLQGVLAIYVIFIFMPILLPLTSLTVGEKEKKIKDTLVLMGMRGSAYWFSLASIYYVGVFFLCIIIAGFMYAVKVFVESNFGWVFLLWLLTALSLINFGFMLSTFFSKVKTVNAVMSLLLILLNFAYFGIQIPRLTGTKVPALVLWLLSLLPPTAVPIAFDQALYVELRVPGGIQTSSLSYTDDIQNFALGNSLLMLFINIVLYALLTAWLDNVLPNVFGKSHSCFFWLNSNYWCSGQHAPKDYSHYVGENVDDVEPMPADMSHKDAIRVYDIKKSFDGKPKPTEGFGGKYLGCKVPEKIFAVNGVTLDMYEGQITALLGHNGAGKTTLINMMTGLMSPSSGTAVIYGQDVNEVGDLGRLQSMLGVCPQHDILFDELSVKEHLDVIAALQGVPENKIEEEVRKTISDVDLNSQEHTLAEDLSGGQRRKLSVGIALIGSPKVILLDEPTAGMDPFSRRKLWAFLKKARHDKVILLTTHFMDEADILADRKAIISRGKLQCCGSSLYLKKKFGIGYQLNMVTGSDCISETVTEFVQQYVKGASLTRVHGKELVYTLPMNETETFSDLFANLEGMDEGAAMCSKLGIKNYGLSMPTLEEVFLKLANISEIQEAEEEELKKKGEEIQVKKIEMDNILLNEEMTYTKSDVSQTPLTISMEEEPHGIVELNSVSLLQNRANSQSLSSQRFWALTKAHAKITVRIKVALVFRWIMPILLAIGGAALLKYTGFSKDFDNPPINNGLSYPTSYPYISTKSPLLYQNSTGESLDSWLSQLNYSYEQVTGMDLPKSSHYLGFNITKMELQKCPSNMIAMYNHTAVHGIPILVNILSNSIYGAIANSSLGNWKIDVISQALPAVNRVLSFDSRVFNSIRILGMGFALMAGWFGFEIVEDREKKIRSQLRSAGVTGNIYWFKNLFVHGVQCFSAVIISTIIFLCFGADEFSTPGAILITIFLIVVYVPMMLIFGYATSYLFKTAETCANVGIWLIMILTTVPYLISSLIEPTDPDIALALHYLFCVIFPVYTLLGGLHQTTKVYLVALLRGKENELTVGDYFDFNNHIVSTWIIMIAHLFIWFMILRIVEVKSTGGQLRDAFCGSPSLNTVRSVDDNEDTIENEDSDVTEERDRVERLSETDHVIMVKYLRKEFARRTKLRLCGNKGNEAVSNIKVAVRNMTFAVEAGEVFGLLGHNGAGKSTTLHTMTADIAPTKGKVSVAGYDITSSLSEAFQNLGFCPQHDALYTILTLREHLDLYAALHGMHKDDTEMVINYYLKSLKIEEHAHKLVKDLSGGTKRKLSFIISILGYPKIVLLDEPSTGMDPASKRFLWDTITTCFSGNPNKGAILTTHAMEEADALCTRIGIMVGGEFKCLGSSQHLKSKHGGGYTLEVKLGQEDRSTEDKKVLADFMEENFPTAVQMEQFADRVIYRLPKGSNVSLAYVFSTMEKAKVNLGIEEYSFSQATLEQVFVEFARQEYEAIEKVKDTPLVPQV